MTTQPVSVVLLVHNEADVIEAVVRGFHDKVAARIPGSEIVVAEDGSTDGTSEILRRLARELPTLRLEQGQERRGYLTALKRAMGLAAHELILFCDASGKHDPDDFWAMYARIGQYDMIVGYKKKRRDPAYRLVLARAFNALVNGYFGVSFHDIDCPFRLMRRSAFLAVAAVPWIQKDLINFEITVRMVKMGFRVTEMPVTHFPRRHGPSRGLPLTKIPRVVVRTVGNFKAIKRSIAQDAQERTRAR